MATIERILNSNILSIESVLSEKTDEIQYLLADRISKIKFDVLNNNQYKVDDTLVRPEILESWLRSKDFGVDPAKTIYGKFVDKNLINTIFKEKQYIVKAVQPFVYSLRRIVNNSNFIFFITDEKGFILYVYPGNELMAERAKQIKMEPGVLCSEEIIGTCAHTLALKLKNPIQVVGAEHFCDSFNERVCSSAPIFDGNKSLLGTVNITTLYSEGRSLYFLGSVISIAMAIENQINTNNLINTILEVSDGSFMILDSNGIVTDLNHKVIDLLEVPYTNIVGYHYKCVIGNQPYIQSVLENGESVSDVNIAIPRINKAIRLLSAQPVGDDNKKYGCILVLESLPELKSTMKEMDGEDLRFAFDKIVGNSAPMQKTREIAMKFSKNDVNILLLGESGTGKEVFAQAIHNQSRPRKPFVAINCSSIPQNLIESELFGYESGAFTGAERKGRKGKIELANEGTLFLDEIGDMPLELQAVFLRVLEDKKVMRIGGNRYIPIDFRLIAATNKNLKELVKLHKFREDLYYRLAVFKLEIPTLRERTGDILTLASYFVQKAALRLRLPVPILSDAVKLQLMNYSWPGNVRQLENAMIFAVSMSKDRIIIPADLPDDVTDYTSSYDSIQAEETDEMMNNRNKLSMKELEKMAIAMALQESGNQVREAAEKLNLSKSTLYRKIREYRILDI